MRIDEMRIEDIEDGRYYDIEWVDREGKNCISTGLSWEEAVQYRRDLKSDRCREVVIVER